MPDHPGECKHGKYESIADKLVRLIEGKQSSKSYNSMVSPNFGHFATHSFSLRFVPDDSTCSSDLLRDLTFLSKNAENIKSQNLEGTVELEIDQTPNVPERFKNENKAWGNAHRWQLLLVIESRKPVVPVPQNETKF